MSDASACTSLDRPQPVRLRMFWDRVCKQLFFSTVADSQSGVKTTSGHKMHRVSGTDFQNGKHILYVFDTGSRYINSILVVEGKQGM